MKQLSNRVSPVLAITHRRAQLIFRYIDRCSPRNHSHKNKPVRRGQNSDRENGYSKQRFMLNSNFPLCEQIVRFRLLRDSLDKLRQRLIKKLVACVQVKRHITETLLLVSLFITLPPSLSLSFYMNAMCFYSNFRRVYSMNND